MKQAGFTETEKQAENMWNTISAQMPLQETEYGEWGLPVRVRGLVRVPTRCNNSVVGPFGVRDRVRVHDRMHVFSYTSLVSCNPLKNAHINLFAPISHACSLKYPRRCWLLAFGLGSCLANSIMTPHPTFGVVVVLFLQWHPSPI